MHPGRNVTADLIAVSTLEEGHPVFIFRCGHSLTFQFQKISDWQLRIAKDLVACASTTCKEVPHVVAVGRLHMPCGACISGYEPQL